MSLVKVEGVSNEVFIPDQITDEDKTFLLERTENIVGIVTRAKVEIGLELLKVEQRFREKKEFGGHGGWYQKWYTSLNITTKQRTQFINSARAVHELGHSADLIETLAPSVLQELAKPSTNSSSNFTGASSSLVEFVVDTTEAAAGGEFVVKDLVADIRAVKKVPAQQILAGEESVATLACALEKATDDWDNRGGLSSYSNEYKALLRGKELATIALDKAKERLESLAAEKAALEAKYENWRSPEAIKQEFEEAIAKARTEEQAKKAAAKAPEASEIAAIRKEREEYAKKAEQAVEVAKQIVQTEQQKAAALEAKLKEAQAQLASSDSRIQKLKDAVAKYQDPKTVDATCLENRIQVVQGTAEHFAELAVTYLNISDQVTDPWMKVRCEKAVKSALQQWLSVLPIDVVGELEMMRAERMAKADAVNEAALVTIDV